MKAANTLFRFILAYALTMVSAPLYAQLAISPPANAKAASGDTVTIPLNLANPNANPIDAFGLKFIFPEASLSFVGMKNAGTLTNGWVQVSAKLTAPQEVTIGGFNFTPATGSGVLLNLTFAVKADTSRGGPLQLRNFSDDLAGASTTDGNFAVTIAPKACDGPAIFAAAKGKNALEPITGRNRDTIYVDIRLQENSRVVGAFGFTVQVNPALLAFAGALPGDLTDGFIDVAAQENPARSGTIICGGYDTTKIALNSSGVARASEFCGRLPRRRYECHYHQQPARRSFRFCGVC